MADIYVEDKAKSSSELRDKIMTKEQRKAYEEFIDYMAELYRRYAYIFEDSGTEETNEADDVIEV